MKKTLNMSPEAFTTTLPSALITLLKVPNTSVAVNDWQLGMIAALTFFLEQAKQGVQEHALSLAPLVISYAIDETAQPDVEGVAKLLHYCFTQVGIPTTLCPLTNAKFLAAALDQHTYAVILSTPCYAARVVEDPNIRQVLDTFGRTQKNALQPLLCAGSFSDTALKIVDGHYLIRSYQDVIKPDPLLALPAFIDIFCNLAGAQGLGILPDILHLTEIRNVTAAEVYRVAFNQMCVRQQQLTIDYRLKISLVESVQNNSLQEHLAQATLPLVKDVPGFRPLVEELLTTSAKMSLLLCPTQADTVLTELALTQVLVTQNIRVLSIECADYPGKAAGDCVRLALQKIKLKTADIDAIKLEPMLILLKGYENIGAYDNIWVKNKLSTWVNVKLLITCRADFFKFRGYLSCFLAEVSNRQVDDLLVYKIPTFASLAAQKLSLSLTSTRALPDAIEVVSLSPKRSAQQSELSVFIRALNQLWIQNNYLQGALEQNPSIFISYAWEHDKTALHRQHAYLSQLAQDLTLLGFPTWLDIERMSGDIDEQMAGNISHSQIAIVIQTPRYSERSQQNTNVKKELDAILQKAQNNPKFRIVPLQFSSDPIAFVLENHPNQCDFTRIDADYHGCMTHPAVGLIPRLLLDTPEKKALYAGVYANFQVQLQLLVAKHLLVDQAQDAMHAYDIDTRLKDYIEPYGLYAETSPLNKRFDLNQHFTTFLDSSVTRTAIILGRAGSGKSLFALHIFKTLLQEWHAYRNNTAGLPTWLPVYIQLRNHTKDPENCIENTLRQFNLSTHDIHALQQGLGHQQRLLFILDGYDELGSGFTPNLTQSLHHWPLGKLLITGRPEHFSKDHPALETLSLYSPAGKMIPSSGEIVYLSPFVPDEIKRYIDFYALNKHTDSHKAMYADTYTTLQKLPGMMVLLDNPFLLSLVLQSLPQLLKNRQGIERGVTRADIYQAFTETWFLQETKGRELDPQDCAAFSQALAWRLFQATTISVSDIPEKRELWEFFNNAAHRAAQDASPLRFSGGEYSFVHKSIYEYFLARRLWLAIPTADCLALWQARLLTEERAVIEFLAEFYQSAPAEANNQLRLSELIVGSRNKDFPAVVSSNAITVLNAARVSFAGRDLQAIRIPDADLTGIIFDHTQLQNADLTGAHLQNAWLREANLTGANLTNVQFGQRPYFMQGREIQSVAYSPNGQWLAASSAHDIVLWDVISGQHLRVLKGHTHVVTSVAFSPDGSVLASGSCDTTLKIWDVERGTLAYTLVGHTDQVHAVAFSRDGLLLVSASNDKTIKCWNVTTRESTRTFSGHVDHVRSVALSMDGLTLASAGLDGMVKLWDLTSGEQLRNLVSHTNQVRTLCFSPDGSVLASGSDDSTLKLWSVINGELTHTFSHAGPVVSLAISPDGSILALANGDKTIQFRNFTNGELLRTLAGHTEVAMSIAFSPDGLTLVSGGGDKTLKFWDVASGAVMRSTVGHTHSASRVAFSRDGLILASGSADKTLKLWNAANGTVIRSFVGHNSYMLNIAFSPDELTLFSGNDDNTIKLWSVAGGEQEPISSLAGHPARMNNIAFSSDGLMVAAAGWDETLKIWQLTDRENMRSLLGHSSFTTCLVFSPDGSMLASGGIDCTVKLWDVVHATLIRSLTGHTSTLNCMTFSPDGLILASGAFDNTVMLWNVANGELMGSFVGHTSTLCSMAFSPDGLILASGSSDHTVKLWSVATGQLLATLNGYLDSITSLTWYQDKLATGSADKSVKCWQIRRGLGDKILFCMLLWSSHVSLDATGCILNQALLSSLNTRLLKQTGAEGYTVILARDYPDWNALHLATANNHLEQLQQVLQAEPGLLDSQTSTGDTALHIAIRYQAGKALAYLLSQGADSWLRNTQNQTPSDLAEDLEQTELLTHLPWVDQENPTNTPLHTAIQNNHLNVVTSLLKQWELGKFNCDINAANHRGETPLSLAIAVNNGVIVALLLDKWGANLHQPNLGQGTAAHIAATNGQIEILQILAAHGADLLARANYGDSPLHSAAANNQPAVLDWLLDQGVPIEVKNDDGETAVHMAVMYDNCLNALKQLKQRGADLCAKNNFGVAPLHVAATSQQVEITRWLLEQGVPIDILQDDGWTPLHLAAHNGQKETVELLLQQGANPQAVTQTGATPVQLARANGKEEIAGYIEQFQRRLVIELQAEQPPSSSLTNVSGALGKSSTEPLETETTSETLGKERFSALRKIFASSTEPVGITHAANTFNRIKKADAPSPAVQHLTNALQGLK